MIDKRIKEGCPFCGTPSSNIQVLIYKNSKKTNGKELGYLTKVYCPECRASFEGFGVMNIINKWNRRYY